MLSEYVRGHFGKHIVVRIFARRLIFAEIHGSGKFTYVMIICARLGKQCVFAYGHRAYLGKRGYGQTVIECAGCLGNKAAKQRRAVIGNFSQFCTGQQSEYRLEHRLNGNSYYYLSEVNYAQHQKGRHKVKSLPHYRHEIHYFHVDDA